MIHSAFRRSGLPGLRRGAVVLLVLSALMFNLTPAQVFVAPDGNDTTNTGTFSQPFGTIGKAYSVVAAGDTIYLRGGVYDSLLTTITLSKSGSPSARYFLVAYAGERALLDFSLMPVSSSNRGIRVSGSYWYIKGIDIKGAGDNGMHVSGSNNIIEFCSFFENHDTGLQLSNGASYNQIINCDSYHNEDPAQGNADGFAAKLDVGTGNYFYGCRSWENSDDGYDGYLRPSDDISTVLNRCWIFKNGYLKNGTASSGNGNGFKLGGSDDQTLRHNVILRNCVAFDNRVKGFDENNDKGSMTLENCTAFRNGTNYGLPGPLGTGKTLALSNCIAMGSYGSLSGFAIQTTNSWMSPFVTDSSDFVSLDTAGVRGPRQPDGSLPDLTFLHLAPGSDLIDAGTDIGMPYNGTAPDLGAFETGPLTAAAPTVLHPVSALTVRNFPNPFNPSTRILFQLPAAGAVSVRIIDLMGRQVRSFARAYSAPGEYAIEWDGKNAGSEQVASGVYFAVVTFGNARVAAKLQLLR